MRAAGQDALGSGALGVVGTPLGWVVELPVPVPVGLPLRFPGGVEESVDALLDVSVDVDVVLLEDSAGGGGVDTTTGAPGVVADDVEPDLERDTRSAEDEVGSTGFGTPVRSGSTVVRSVPVSVPVSVWVEPSVEVVDDVPPTWLTSPVSLMAEVYVVAATTRHTPAEPQRVMYHADVRGLRWRPPTRHRLP